MLNAVLDKYSNTLSNQVYQRDYFFSTFSDIALSFSVIGNLPLCLGHQRETDIKIYY